MTSKNKVSTELHKNKALNKESKEWEDTFYIEELDLLYRKDKNNIWYDVQGFRVASPFMIKGNYLISLNGKAIFQSIAVRSKSIFTSIQNKLVQIDKIVLDESLTPINYLGHKVTEIGKKYITFSNDIIQEIVLSSKKKAFIYASTGLPFLIDSKEISEHITTIKEANLRFEVFSDGKNNYWLKTNSTDILRLDNDPINIDPDSIVNFNNRFLAKANKHRKPEEVFYVDLEHTTIFSLDELGEESIVHIGTEFLDINGNKMFNIRTENRAFVYNNDLKKLYQPSTIEYTNFQLESINGFESHFCTLIFGDKKLVYDVKNEEILQFEGRKISAIHAQIGEKLFNATDEYNQPIVLDARHGLDKLKLAYSMHIPILSVTKPINVLGSKILQSAYISTLGGQQERYIDLNSASLEVFTLPVDLRSYPEQPNLSLYAGRPIISIDFDHIITVEDVQFINATFLSFTDRIEKLILQKSNGEPLHFVGPKHRNELVSSLVKKSLIKRYFIGENRMLVAKTLDEAGVSQQLLFSLSQNNSWLAFNDQFLPILKDIEEVKVDAAWSYYLFELREKNNESQYLVVEKSAPYRILVEKKSNKYQAKIFKASNPLPQVPEEVSAFRKLFMQDPGILINFE